MYYKLVGDCICFKSRDIEMLGNPRTGVLFGLDDKGALLVNRLMNGCDIEVANLSKSEKELMDALSASKQFVSSNQLQTKRAAYFHLTSSCNMNCPGCYSISERNIEMDLSINDVKKIIDNLSNAHVKSLVISGGEPFLRKDIVEILRYIKLFSKIEHVCCISNGLAKIDTYIEACKYIDELSFSLDGFSEESSCFRRLSHNKVVETIKQLDDFCNLVSIIFTLHKKNLMNYKRMRDLAKTLHVNYEFSIFTVPHSNEVSEFEFTEEDILLLKDIIISDNLSIADTSVTNKIGCRDCCGAGSKILSVSANGNVFPCHMFFDEQFLLGNALEDNLNDIYMNHKPLFSVNEKTECSKCEYQYICGGGCLFRSYIIRGHLEDTDPLCPLYVSHIEKTLSALIG